MEVAVSPSVGQPPAPRWPMEACMTGRGSAQKSWPDPALRRLLLAAPAPRAGHLRCARRRSAPARGRRVADVDPARARAFATSRSTSGRRRDFDQVYRVPGRDDLLMRDRRRPVRRLLVVGRIIQTGFGLDSRSMPDGHRSTSSVSPDDERHADAARRRADSGHRLRRRYPRTGSSASTRVEHAARSICGEDTLVDESDRP